MDDYTEGITAKSEKLCQTLLKGTQPPPEHTLFSDDYLFKKTCKRIRGENETKVVRDIAPLIVPSAEILADRGAGHLEILRETVNACWVNSITFMKPPGSRPGPRPQPDFGLGFKRDAFSREQLQKLRPYIGDPLADSSLIAATVGDAETASATRQQMFEYGAQRNGHRRGHGLDNVQYRISLRGPGQAG